MILPHPRLRVQILRETLLKGERLKLFIQRQWRRASRIDAQTGDFVNGETGRFLQGDFDRGGNCLRQTVDEITWALARHMRIVRRQIHACFTATVVPDGDACFTSVKTIHNQTTH